MTTSDNTRPDPAPQHPVQHRPLRRTRVSAAWTATIVSAVLLILLLVFILQNSQRVDVSFLGAHGHLPLGVAMLFAAVSGILLVAVPGTARILQLRRATRKALAAQAPTAPTAAPQEIPPPGDAARTLPAPEETGTPGPP